MTDQDDTATTEVTEVVGRFASRETFKAAVEDLKKAGFTVSDLSVLDTHESLSAAGSSGAAWRETLSGLVGEIKYVEPLTAAGLIALATGSVGMAVAAAVAAGLASASFVELLDYVKATPHTENFARALEAGAIMLWVRAESEERQKSATGIMKQHGAADVHCHRRLHKNEPTGK